MKPLAVLLFLAACQPPADTNDTDTTAGGDDTDTGGGDTNGSGDHDTTIESLSGTLTWHVDFDADAEAAGFQDCDYTRTYSNGYEQRYNPWTCPTCEVELRVDAEMTSGRDTCFGQFSTDDPAPQETLGWGNGVFYRTYSENYALSEQGTATADATSLTTHNDTPFQFTDGSGATRNATFAVDGSFTRSTTTGDPMRGLYPPDTYTCGWPKADPPAYTGDYVLAVGEQLPDGVFMDDCNEPVRLQDFKGKWLVIDVSATDCGPCQQMAKGEGAFLGQATADGLDVEVITLLEPSLGDPTSEADRATLDDWIMAFDVSGPVLADRAYGVWVLGSSTEAITGESFGYPTWIVVDPDLNVVGENVGFGTWDDVRSMIDSAR